MEGHEETERRTIILEFRPGSRSFGYLGPFTTFGLHTLVVSATDEERVILSGKNDSPLYGEFKILDLELDAFDRLALEWCLKRGYIERAGE